MVRKRPETSNFPTFFRSLHRATVTAALASRDDTFAEALKLEAEEFGEEAISKITSFEARNAWIYLGLGA